MSGGEWGGGGRRRSAGHGSDRPPKVSPAERRARHASETDPAVVLAAAARALESRPLSVMELQRRLRLAGYPGDLIDGTVSRLVDLGYLDDDAFARAWVESRDRTRPRGERALRTELDRKGVDRAVVDSVLDDRRATGESLGEDGRSADEAAAARLLARHAAALGRVADPRARRQRAYGLLARNGFDPDVAMRVSRTVDEAAPTDLPADP